MKFALLFLIPLGLFAQNYDVLIRNGHIVDGTGSPWYAADVAIRDGHIAAIGHLDTAPPNRRSTRRAWWWRRLYRHAGAIGTSILVNPICRRRFIRESPPRSPVRATRPRR